MINATRQLKIEIEEANPFLKSKYYLVHIIIIAIELNLYGILLLVAGILWIYINAEKRIKTTPTMIIFKFLILHVAVVAVVVVESCLLC